MNSPIGILKGQSQTPSSLHSDFLCRIWQRARPLLYTKTSGTPSVENFLPCIILSRKGCRRRNLPLKHHGTVQIYGTKEYRKWNDNKHLYLCGIILLIIVTTCCRNCDRRYLTAVESVVSRATDRMHRRCRWSFERCRRRQRIACYRISFTSHHITGFLNICDLLWNGTRLLFSSTLLERQEGNVPLQFSPHQSLLFVPKSASWETAFHKHPFQYLDMSTENGYRGALSRKEARKYCIRMSISQSFKFHSNICRLWEAANGNSFIASMRQRMNANFSLNCAISRIKTPGLNEFPRFFSDLLKKAQLRLQKFCPTTKAINNGLRGEKIDISWFFSR